MRPRKFMGLSSNSIQHLAAALLAGALISSLGAGTANAQSTPSAADRETAHAAYGEGRAAFDKGDFETAYQKFKLANETIPSPHAAFYVAMSLDEAGKTEQAKEEFDKLLADPNVGKLGEDKLNLAKERQRALEAELAMRASAMEPEPEPEPEPEVVDPQAVIQSDFGESAGPPPEEQHKPFMLRLTPTDGMWEVGILTGPIIISRAHKLHDEERFRRAYMFPSWMYGLRLGYFPSKYVGLEGELAFGTARVRTVDQTANLLTYRGHIAGQLPDWRLTPYAVLGVGAMHANSDAMGSDTDFMLYFGLGAKLAVTEYVALRLDIREDLTEHVDAGMAGSEEILLGFSLTFGRE